MSMNSFSSRPSRSRKKNRRDPWEEEISELIDLNQNGEPLDPTYLTHFQKPHFQPVDLEQFKKNWNDPKPGYRKSPRFALNLSVLVCNRFKTFRSESENISLSGILIKDLMPEEFSQEQFEIILIEENGESQNKYLLFRGKTIDGPLRTNRFKFDSLTPATELQLLELISTLTPLG